MGRQELILACACACALTARAARADDTDEQRARELYAQAVTHYDLAEYDDAIALFKESYQLSRAPRLLFNIAQAYRLKGTEDCRNAVQFYRNYLRLEPDAENRPAVEEWIRDLDPCAQQERAPAPTQTPAPAAVTPPSERTPPTPRRAAPPPEPSHLARWSLLGGGALAVGVGGGVLAWVAHDYNNAKIKCHPDCTETRGRLELRADIAYVTLAVGAALAASGAVLWIREDREHATYVAPTGSGIALGGWF